MREGVEGTRTATLILLILRRCRIGSAFEGYPSRDVIDNGFDH